MRLVVDTNIVFSAILNSSSNIGKILIDGRQFDFYSCHFLLEELQQHRGKLKRISGLSDDQLSQSIELTTANITFVQEDLLPKKDWKFAFKILSKHDQKDIPFLALAHNLKAHLWSGDKKLFKALEKENYNKTITTSVILNKLAHK
jgi:predicted nucleic acid-binding protein